MRGIRLWVRLAAVAVVGAAALAAAGAAAALGAPGTFTVTLLPGSLTAGNAAVVQGTFTNTGSTADSAVTLTFTFPFNVSVPLANGCVSVPGSPTRVACIVGQVGAGQTASRAFQFTVPSGTTGSVTVSGLAAFLSASPPRGGVLVATATATAYLPGQVQLPFTLPNGSTQLAASSGCVGSGGTVTATTSGDVPQQWEGSNAQTQVTAGSPGNLPCTPIVAAVATDPTTGGADFIVKVPNGSQVTATLSFPDEFLPFSADNDGQGLFEYPNYPATTPQDAVPFCNSADNPGGWPTAPASTDSCIQSLTVNDTTDNDGDEGTAVLRVTGTANDPGYH